ncbi:TetR/AcrR family transcriptional regulator [Microbispora bryophytorum]|uniref:TetR family transcriptional regulator C-terminal domain-containing protein n=1 Tax=Microbispora bryophytorum subsp. camponoti TaxID=1677852 RepID=A0ABR8LFC0_9ACTN|nr:TetR family transcriptional regulator C-terminal domain-containing protein [Microbispora camponoti]MBD3148200.1 TetR family transcriptional regulator C-terminal domain-containing protein [Microbispora camponoti]
MPKIVDHRARREEIAEALWRVVRRDGVSAATVRSIAAEAGWSPSALRHYFSTQAELLAFAMEHVVTRVRARIETTDFQGPVRVAVRRLLEELLPMDAERRAEAEVWLQLSALTPGDPAAADWLRRADDGVGEAATIVVRVLAEEGELAGHRDAEFEAVRLHTLIDGLTIHVLARPESMPPERVSAVLAAHLEDLAT